MWISLARHARVARTHSLYYALPRLELLACSDGSVIGGGVEGSVAAILVIAGQQGVTSVVRLALADRALSSGRAEWVGLVRVFYIVRRVRAGIVLRLDNSQVVNTYNDGNVEYEWDWLRRNDRDLAALAWELNVERRRLGFGELVAVYQLGRPDNRKRPHEYDYHERYNARVNALTHELALGMPCMCRLREWVVPKRGFGTSLLSKKTWVEERATR